ncbi:outer dense fiber protein 2 isoform X1 [Camarhynchus parvulus]|uniref:Outer dense fiber protein 2 n=4 Tax=Thraupidae TaxID=400783 RepID=A0A8C3QDW1_GEOPR|nr:outer dense fiber protein 2 isoform X1 [Camarhynchus parvulus]XP_030817474.1 outer dense fiber protein 2 isoform X1 [Camarhynchus parvulus]
MLTKAGHCFSLNTEGNVVISSFRIHRFPFIAFPFPICGRRAMKNRCSSPPLHVHVDENTPVHVHIKKGQKTAPAKCQQKHKQKSKGDGVRAVRVKTKAPWIPPGKTSTRDTILKWEQESGGHLEAPPITECDRMQSVMRLSDLSTDDDDPTCCKINKYEKKIDSLMNMVGTLKKEVKIQQMEEQEEITKRLLEEQKEELNEMTQELVETENENTRLRRNIERIKEEKDLTVLQKECLQQEKECLMTKLSEAERDGAAAARQIHALRNTIGRLNIEKHMSSTDINALTRQKELLLQKLSTFEETNRTLRELLAEHQSREKDAQKVMDRQATLLKRLADLDAENMQLQIRLQGKEKEVETLTLQIVAEKEQAKKAFELARSLESVKAHLQAQLRSREAENDRLLAQLQNMEISENHTKEEMDLLLEQLQDLRCKAESDKEALKKAVRAQKERAERSEEYVQRLTAQLAEKETAVAEAQCNLEGWRNRCSKAMKEKDDLELEVVTLNSRVADLTEQLARIQEQTRDENEALVDKLQQLTGENSALKKDNEKLKAALISMEDKLNQAQMELQHLQNSVRSYEGLIETYTAQAQMARKEADELAARLEKCEKENEMLKEEMNREIEETREKFQSQLAELEKLPEILKYTETQLAECHQQLMCYEKKNTDLCGMIADLRQLIDLQGDKMEMTRERYQSAQEEKKQLTLKVEELERKLESTSAQNIEFLQVIAKREESIHQCQLRLEEKSRECSSLARQLEMAIEDAKRQVEQARERAVSRERAAQSKVLDLETQLSRNKTELNQLHRSKDDAERRYESRLQDLRDRLEQSESTNRSMQNYVQFLKSSYDNVFRECPFLSSSLSPTRSLL